MKSKGILYIVMSALFFSLMAVFVKSLPDIPLSQKMFFRNIIGLIAISVTIYQTKGSLISNNPKLMFLRSLFGLLGVGFYYAAIERMNLADAVVLNKLSPVFVVIFAVIFLGERIRTRQKVALILALLGAVLVVNPSFDMSIIPGTLGVLSAFFAGAAYTVIRRLTAYDRPVLIVFYFCLFSSLVMIPFMWLQGFVLPTTIELLLLIGIGVSALLGQLFMTNAYKQAAASEISIYTYSDTLFSMMFGYLIWSELPGTMTVFGGVAIVGAGIINVLNFKRKKQVS